MPTSPINSSERVSISFTIERSVLNTLSADSTDSIEVLLMNKVLTHCFGSLVLATQSSNPKPSENQSHTHHSNPSLLRRQHFQKKKINNFHKQAVKRSSIIRPRYEPINQVVPPPTFHNSNSEIRDSPPVKNAALDMSSQYSNDTSVSISAPIHKRKRKQTIDGIFPQPKPAVESKVSRPFGQSESRESIEKAVNRVIENQQSASEEVSLMSFIGSDYTSENAVCEEESTPAPVNNVCTSVKSEESVSDIMNNDVVKSLLGDQITVVQPQPVAPVTQQSFTPSFTVSNELLGADKRRYSCPICAYSSTWRQCVQRHIASSHCEERPFRCPYCEYSCKLKDNLDKHVRVRHSEKWGELMSMTP